MFADQQMRKWAVANAGPAADTRERNESGASAEEMVADMKEWAVTGRPRDNVMYEKEGVRRLEVGWWDVRHALALGVSFFLL